MQSRFAIVGYGAIAEEIVRCLGEHAAAELAGVLVRPGRRAEAAGKAANRFLVVDDLDALLALRPTGVLECAGHGAMRQYAKRILESGVDLYCASVGALADPALAGELVKAGARGARLYIPSGAIAGIDGLLAARSAGLRNVTYTSIKPPRAWEGTPAGARVAGAGREERLTLFEGSAREAAGLYPQNVNVGVTVALAGLGMERTRIRLVSDPSASGPLGIIEADGDFGTFRFEILAYASPTNPKTSAITAHSMLMAWREGMCFSALPLLNSDPGS